MLKFQVFITVHQVRFFKQPFYLILVGLLDAIQYIAVNLPNRKENHEYINLDLQINLVQFHKDRLEQLKCETSRDTTLSELREIIVDG
jgi:hypothetical protein